MTSIFVSYSRADADVVLPFADRLRAAGFEVWIDQASIQAAVPWREEITKAIRSSDFVIAAQSPAWHASTSCADEYRIAQEQEKTFLYIDLADQSADWVDAARECDAQIDLEERARSALLGDSYRWHQAGRASAHLVSGAVLRAYRGALWSTDDPLARDFVRRSSRRVWRRRVTAALVVLVTFVLVLGRQVASGVAEELAARTERNRDDLAVVRQVSAATGRSPVEALRVAADLAVDEDTWARRYALSTALRTELPSSVDSPPAKAPGPAAALARGTRVAGPDGRALVVVEEGIRVDAGDEGLLVRLPGTVSALAWSVDGTRFAAATSTGVRVVRVSTGRQLALLNGFDGALEALGWDDDVTLAGSFGGTRVRWTLPWSPIPEDFDWPVMHLVSGPGGAVLAVGDGGQLVLVDQGAVRRLPALSGGGRSAAAATDAGWLVAVSDGESAGVLVELSAAGEVGRTVELGACDPSALVRGSDGGVHVACMFGDVLDVNAATGQVTPFAVRDFQVMGLVVDSDGTLLATSVQSELFRRTGSGWSMVGQWAGGCVSGASVVVPSPDGDRILVTGASVAGFCTHLRNDPEDRGKQTRVVPPSSIQSFRDAAWSPDGRTLVAAAASGELWVFDAEEYITRALPLPTGEALRSVVFIDPQHVLVGSDDGELVVVDVSVAVADLPGQLTEARERIARAEAAGIG